MFLNLATIIDLTPSLLLLLDTPVVRVQQHFRPDAQPCALSTNLSKAIAVNMAV